MAETYRLKYYADFRRQGHTERIEIHILSSSSVTALRMGNIVSVNLKNQGSADGIDDPIVKTHLDITLVDQWDKPVTGGTKYGDWEEFYTSDALLYKVIYLQDGQKRWTGFLTPDSWTEKLEYHGTITITARDMLGHMQDFPFDASGDMCGMISVRDVIEKGLEKASVSMAIGTDMSAIGLKGGVSSKTARQYDVSRMLLNIEAFEGKTWFQAVEDVLDSLCMTLRYADNNVLFCGLLKDLPSFVGSQSYKTVQFVNLTGTRELDPACRRIVDTVDYKSDAIYTLKMREEDLEPATRMIMSNRVNTWVPKSGTRMVATGKIGVMNNFTLNADPRNSGSGESPKYKDDTLYLSVRAKSAASLDTGARISVDIPVSKSDVDMKLVFTIGRFIYYVPGTYYQYLSANKLSVGMKYSIEIVPAEGKSRYLKDDGTWDTSEAVLDAVASGSVDNSRTAMQVSFERSFTTPGIVDGIRVLRLNLYGMYAWVLGGTQRGITSTISIDGNIAKGVTYGALSGLELTQTSRVSAKHTTTTTFNEKNNVIIERSSPLGQVPSTGGPKVIQNGIYMPEEGKGFPAVLEWWLDGSAGEAGHLDVIKHKMLLCYHCRPLNVLTGEVRDATAQNPRFNDIYRYNGWKLLLAGGTLNILNGRITGANLREYAAYKELWAPNTLEVSPALLVDLSYSSGSYALSITASSSMSWTITGIPSWITISRTSGKGSAELSLTVGRNTTGTERKATLKIGSRTVEIAQNGYGSWNLSTYSLNIGPAAYNGDITVSTPSGEEGWSLRSDASWLEVDHDSVYTASGNGDVVIDVSANGTTSPRTGRLVLTDGAGEEHGTVLVYQRGQSARAYIDAETCVACGACDDILLQVCPVGVIREGTELVGNCIGCMECQRTGVEYVCPASSGGVAAFRFR